MNKQRKQTMNKINDIAKQIKDRTRKRWSDMHDYKPPIASKTPTPIYHSPIMAYEQKAKEHLEKTILNETAARECDDNNQFFLASSYRNNAIRHALKFKEYSGLSEEEFYDLFESGYIWKGSKRSDDLPLGSDNKRPNPFDVGHGKKAKVRASVALQQKWKKEQEEGKRSGEGGVWGPLIAQKKPRGRPKGS